MYGNVSLSVGWSVQHIGPGWNVSTNGLPWKCVQTLMVPQTMCSYDFGDPLQVDSLDSEWNVWTTMPWNCRVIAAWIWKLCKIPRLFSAFPTWYCTADSMSVVHIEAVQIDRHKLHAIPLFLRASFNIQKKVGWVLKMIWCRGCFTAVHTIHLGPNPNFGHKNINEWKINLWLFRLRHFNSSFFTERF